MNEIQGKIQSGAYSSAQRELDQHQETSKISNPKSSDGILPTSKNFYLLLSTVVWFIEHDPYTNVTMNLDVNYCRVFQDNYLVKSQDGKTMTEGIMEENGTTFQNSPIHLLFYEKISQKDYELKNLDLSFDSFPELSSMSCCKVKKTKPTKFAPLAYNLELQIIPSDVTAQFVTLEQYEQLMYVLGQKPHSTTGRSGQEVLTLFNQFPTNTEHNFRDMLHRLQLPFKYDVNKTLFENRSDFRDFFSCLTNIRCAVIEGQH